MRSSASGLWAGAKRHTIRLSDVLDRLGVRRSGCKGSHRRSQVTTRGLDVSFTAVYIALSIFSVDHAFKLYFGESGM